MKEIWQQTTQTSDTGTILDVPLPVALLGIGVALALAAFAYWNMRKHK